MADAKPIRMQLSRALNEALTPSMRDLGFDSVDVPEDDPIHKLWEAMGDGTDGRRFVRKSPLGYDTFACRFTQRGNDITGFVGVGTEIGIHIEAFETAELRLQLDINPYRIGKRLSNIWQIQPEVMNLKTLDEVEVVVAKMMQIVHTEGTVFWSAHMSLDEVQQHFESWPVSERHSPKGGAHVSNYLLLIAYLKRDRGLFERIVQEYRPYLGAEVYQNAFNHRVQVLTDAFGNEID